MKSDRDLPTVINCMLSLIPEEETSLRASLLDAQSSAEFAAPEMNYHFWLETAEALEEYLPADPAEHNDWQKAIVKIWQNKNTKKSPSL